MAAVIEAVAGLITALIPVGIFYVIATHLQAFNQEAGNLAKLGGVAIGDAIAPVIAGTLVVFAGLGGITLLFYAASKRVAGPDEHVPVPTVAPLSANAPSFGSSVGFTGGGLSLRGGSEPGGGGGGYSMSLPDTGGRVPRGRAARSLRRRGGFSR